MTGKSASLAPAAAMPPAAAVSGITGVESRNFVIRDFALESGKMLPEAKVAYETYGGLDATGRNAVLLAHEIGRAHV